MIVTVHLKPGATVSETVLMAQTGFGRTPVREALLRLADVGLVAIAPRSGTLVTRTDPEDQLQVLEVRRVLERLIVAQAAVKTGAAEKAVFSAMANEMRTAAAMDDHLLFLRVDRRFNRFVAASAGNRHLVRSITPIHALTRRFWYAHYQPSDLTTAANLHARIMEAIASGDADAAAAASDALLKYVEAFTRAVSDAAR